MLVENQIKEIPFVSHSKRKNCVLNKSYVWKRRRRRINISNSNFSPSTKKKKEKTFKTN